MVKTIMGTDIITTAESAHDHDHDPDAERRWLWAVTSVVGMLLVADVVFGLGSPWQRPFGVPLALAAAVIGGGRVVYLALAALLEGSIGADIALAVACIAAACLGEYFVAAEVVFIALVGECLEALTFERAQRAIGKLLDFYPRTARVIREETEVEVPTDQVAVGDRVVVRPGERITVDGVVVRGRSAVDQAVLTGESMPVDKGEGDPVYTGTVNQFGRLEIRADKLGKRPRWARSSAYWLMPSSIVPHWSERPTATPAFFAGCPRHCRDRFWERMVPRSGVGS